MHDESITLPGTPGMKTQTEVQARLDGLSIEDGYHAVWCMVCQFAEERKLSPSELMTIFDVGLVAADPSFGPPSA